MGQQFRGPDARVRLDHRPEQSAGLEHPLDEQLAPALADQVHGTLGALPLAAGLHQRLLRDVFPLGAGDGADTLHIPHQNRGDQPIPPGLEHGLQGVLVVGGGHHRRLGSGLPQLRFQLLKSRNNQGNFLLKIWVVRYLYCIIPNGRSKDFRERGKAGAAPQGGSRT